MELDDLIEAIRKEEVALVIGSGMSLYAGYLGVKELTALICKKAQSYCREEWEQKSLEDKSLEDISEILIRYANDDRSELNSILVSIYKKTPLDTHTHDLLARIPHFEHIFTTNYDTLIEDSMAKRCHVIGSENAFSAQMKGITKVYKLHGDVNNLNDVVISRKDYASNIRGQQKNLLWNRFTDVIASKDILFIGHGNEDSNFWGIFEELSVKLKAHQRKRFFISPAILQHQEQNLKRNGFDYFQMNADQFLNVLYPKLVEYAVSDLETGKLSSNTFQQFLALNDRNAIIRSEDSKIIVEAITGPSGAIESEVHFSLAQDVFEKFMNFNDGITRDRTFKFLPEDLVDFSFNMSGYKFGMSRETLSRLEVMLIHENRMLDIESADGRIEITKIPVKQFKFQDGSDMELEFYGSKFNFSFKSIKAGIEVKFSYTLLKEFSNLTELIGTLKFLHALYRGETLNFYFDGKTKVPIINTCPTDIVFKKWRISTLIEHFEQLQLLGRKFDVRFALIKFDQITQSIIDEVSYIFWINEKGFVEKEFRNVIFLPSELKRYGFKSDSEDDIMRLIFETSNPYQFYGTTLPACYSVLEVIGPEIVGEGEKLAVRSKSDRIRHKILSQLEFDEFQQRDIMMISTKDL
ncbi:SIR2 family NAD-dependent protein deacylase [Pedobacter roseus]|uniref:SIR2 family protein n=1 Tax=Pedobacter roseus TaxID=336820 RepID=A0A7G9QHW9_9SPHI|nr:SIR2 family protein [Pedobacter roseus]QNN42944.1 SIR2 family protein [Pedobacter roseus]